MKILEYRLKIDNLYFSIIIIVIFLLNLYLKLKVLNGVIIGLFILNLKITKEQRDICSKCGMIN